MEQQQIDKEINAIYSRLVVLDDFCPKRQQGPCVWYASHYVFVTNTYTFKNP